MSQTVISIEDISKKYLIGHQRDASDGLRHRIEDAVRHPFRWLSSKNAAQNPSRHGDKEEFWALKNISLEIKQGEVLGIVGRNGAGKSTMLKILSRITEPTTGRIRLKGRVASLLEVGTGFHQELTGRENIFLNGAILGMSKADIRRRFDEIVAFSEIEKFLDTPVKRYSSGMYVRLAFAVAAHLEPDILIVDEVLAVGDAQFQKKCLGKMNSVAKEKGRTILFVTHNMAPVASLCSRALFLQNGQVKLDGTVQSVIGAYMQGSLSAQAVREWPDPRTAPGNSDIRLSHIRVSPPDGAAAMTVDTGAHLEVGFHNYLPNINLDCTLYVLNSEGILLFESGCIVSRDQDSRVGRYAISGCIPPHFLNAGRYYVNVLFGKDQRYALFRFEDAVSFQLENTNTGRGQNMSAAPGVVRPLIRWEQSFQQQIAPQVLPEAQLA
jgi:lipopolysaccharide transport system ATP-binding protein